MCESSRISMLPSISFKLHDLTKPRNYGNLIQYHKMSPSQDQQLRDFNIRKYITSMVYNKGRFPVSPSMWLIILITFNGAYQTRNTINIPIVKHIRTYYAIGLNKQCQE